MSTTPSIHCKHTRLGFAYSPPVYYPRRTPGPVGAVPLRTEARGCGGRFTGTGVATGRRPRAVGRSAPLQVSGFPKLRVSNTHGSSPPAHRTQLFLALADHNRPAEPCGVTRVLKLGRLVLWSGGSSSAGFLSRLGRGSLSCLGLKIGSPRASEARVFRP